MKSSLTRCRKCGVGFHTKAWGQTRCPKCERIVDATDMSVPLGEMLIVGGGVIVIVAIVAILWYFGKV